MKTFRPTILLLLIGSMATLLASCAPSEKQQALDQLDALYADARANSKNYTTEQWNVYLTAYQQADSILSLYRFEGEEERVVNRMRSRCAAYAHEASVVMASQQLGDALRQSRGIFRTHFER